MRKKQSRETLEIDLTREEIDALARWHEECEKRCVEMREYTMAQGHCDRARLFESLRNCGWYLRTNGE